MNIRKQFKYEMGHVVRNAWSKRCRNNAHGHSYLVEFVFSSPHPDNGQMVTDFGFIKHFLDPFVDSFDHSFAWWNISDDIHLINFFKENFDRVVVTPFSTTAEMQAKMFFVYASKVIEFLCYANNKHFTFVNGEAVDYIDVNGVKVHETRTGYAEYTEQCTIDDQFPDVWLNDIEFSDGIQKEWPHEFTEFYAKLLEYEHKQQNIN